MSRRRSPIVFAIVLIAVTACSTAQISPPVAPALAPTVAPVFVSATDSAGSSQEQSPVEVYRRANPAVVNIAVVLATQDSSSQGADMAQGSGFLYDTEGRIVTNNHVVAGATRIEVTFADGSTQRARILGVDPDTDLAVLKVDAVPTGTQPLPLGDSGALQVGQSVAAIGNPFGLEGTLTLGIVSAIGRVVPSGLSQFSIPQVIQTDAAINPGNSGGPLLNLRGEVVGVNTQIRTADGVRANSGVGFAVPSNSVARVVPALIADGRYTWPWLGVRGGSVTTAIAQANDLGQLRGAAREQTVDGLTMPIGGDVVTAVDGNLVRTFDDLLTYIALRAQVGQVVQLTVQRDGGEQTSAVTLDARPRAEEANP